MARYLSQLDSADRQPATEALAAKTTRLKEKLARLKEDQRLFQTEKPTNSEK